jgi:Putative Ig domain
MRLLQLPGALCFLLLLTGTVGCGSGNTLSSPPATPLSFSAQSLPNAQMGSSYVTTLQISGGSQPYAVTLISGAIPGGLTMSDSGVITGTPAVVGAFTFTLNARDSASPAHTSTATFTLTVSPQPLTASTSSLPTAIAGAAYSQAIAVSGGTAPYTFAIGNGSLPAGLSLSTAGLVYGTPTAVVTGVITVLVTDSSSTRISTSAPVTINVVNAIVSVDSTITLAVVPQTAFGMHTSVYDAGLSDTALLPALLQTGGITTLRYPGGVYSDNYHWAQNSLTPWFASTVPACGVASNGYLAPNTDFGHFIKTLQATGTQAIITVNYGTSLGDSNGSRSLGSYGPNTCSEPFTSGQPQEAAAWVAYANGSATDTTFIGTDGVGFNWRTVGFWASLRAASPLAVDDGYNFLRIGRVAPVGVKYWELGNEIFYNGYSNNQNYETDLHGPYAYTGGYAGSFGSRTGVSTLSPASYGTNAVAFIQAMRAVDPSIKIGLDLSSPNVDPITATWNPAALNTVCAGATIDFGIFHYYPGNFNAVTAAQLFSRPQTDMPALVSGVKTQLATFCPGNASSVQFFITETGPNGSYASGTPAQITGLYAMHEYLTAIEAGIVNIDWLELHSGNYLVQGSEAPSTAYYGIQLAHLLADVGDRLVSTTSTGKLLVSHATLKANGQRGILLLNSDPLNSATVQVSLSGNTLGTTATQYSYGVATTQTLAALASTTFAVSGNSIIITLQPYTATVILTH